MANRAVLASMAGAAVVLSASAVLGQGFVSSPRLMSGPSEEEVEGARPAGVSKDVYGKARIRCKVSAEGELSACIIVDEEPKGLGFGDAVLSLLPKYKVEPARRGTMGFQSEILLGAAFGEQPREAIGAVLLPKYLSGPTRDEVLAAWPRIPWANAIEGRASLSCTLNVEGRLQDCRVLDELPAAGFGLAALKLAPTFRYEPGTRGGVPAPVEYPITISFDCEDDCEPFQPPRDFSGPLYSLQWLQTPTAAEVRAAHPPGRESIAGFVKLFCVLGNEGDLRRCTPLVESPEGAGFAKAALGLASGFRGPKARLDGTSLRGGGVQVPISFPVVSAAPPRPGQALVVRVPGPADYAAAFPQAALEAEAKGETTVRCRVGAGGEPQDCALVREHPVGLGFGAAAMSLISKVQFNTWSDEGQPTQGAAVQIPILFQLPPPQAPASAAPSADAPKPIVITRPDWAQRPSVEQMSSVFPSRAAQRGQGGRATLECEVQGDGRVKDCQVMAEAPANFGFGDAALKASRWFRLNPSAVDGVSTAGARVRVEIMFGF